MLDVSNKSSDQNLLSLYKELDTFACDFRNANLMELVAQSIHGCRVLDIGCGSGFLLQKLKSQGRNVVGLEPNEELISLAHRMQPDLRIIRGHAEGIKNLVSENIDTITMIDVLEHISKDTAVLRSLFDILSPGGQCIIVVPAYQFLYGIRDKDIGHFRRYSKKVLKERMEAAGFRIYSMHYWNMLGVIPYFISEKIFRRALHTSLRTTQARKGIKRFLNKVLVAWFQIVENKMNLGFGLSIICVGEKQ